MSEYFEELKEVLEGCHDYGYYLAAICAFHDDNRPSLFVYEDTYKCVACGTWGYTKDLLKRLDKTKVKYRNYDEQRSVNPFSRWLRTESLYSICLSAWNTINRSPFLGNYIYKRGIDERYRRALGIGYKEDWWTIPIFSREQKLVGCVARANPETTGKSKYTQPHGTNPNLLYAPNWKLYERSRYVIVNFGIFDAVSLSILGFSAVSTICGKTPNPGAFNDMRKPIYIFPDRGEEREAHMLASKLGWRGKVIIFPFPELTKDANDVFVYDKDYLKRFIYSQIEKDGVCENLHK